MIRSIYPRSNWEVQQLATSHLLLLVKYKNLRQTSTKLQTSGFAANFLELVVYKREPRCSRTWVAAVSTRSAPGWTTPRRWPATTAAPPRGSRPRAPTRAPAHAPSVACVSVCMCAAVVDRSGGVVHGLCLSLYECLLFINYVTSGGGKCDTGT